MALVTEKYQKCRKKIILGERWNFGFLGFITVFSGEIVHLKITAKKNLFLQQFGNHIKILKQKMFFKGSEYIFQSSFKKRFFYEFSYSGKISPIKT